MVPEPGDDDDEAEDGEGDGESNSGRVSMLGVLDAMSERYHEHRQEMLLRWGWPFFCAQWARMLDYARGEKRKKERREQKRQQAETAEALERRLAMGAGVGVNE